MAPLCPRIRPHSIGHPLLKILLLTFLTFVCLSTSWAEQQRDIETFTLRGILVSDSNRIALLNGRSVRAGDTVDGVKVVEIGDRSVVLQARSQHFRIHVGATPVPADFRPVTQPRPAQHAALENTRPVRNHADAAQQHHVRVQSGDTLSEIALDLLQNTFAGSDMSLQQVMLALFAENPDAFAGNIHRLHAGTTLTIPALGGPRWLAKNDARSAAIPQQTNRDETTAKEVPDAHRIGQSVAVAAGDNLSTIAVQLIKSGAVGPDASLDQLMVALYDTNRQAFAGNVNVLFAGATLNLPSPDALMAYSPTDAMALIHNHHQRWRQSKSAPAADPLVAQLPTQDAENISP